MKTYDYVYFIYCPCYVFIYVGARMILTSFYWCVSYVFGSIVICRWRSYRYWVWCQRKNLISCVLVYILSRGCSDNCDNMICLYTYVSLSVTLDIYDVWPYGYTKINLQKLRIFNTQNTFSRLKSSKEAS